MKIHLELSIYAINTLVSMDYSVNAITVSYTNQTDGLVIDSKPSRFLCSVELEVPTRMKDLSTALTKLDSKHYKK